MINLLCNSYSSFCMLKCKLFSKMIPSFDGFLISKFLLIVPYIKVLANLFSNQLTSEGDNDAIG